MSNGKRGKRRASQKRGKRLSGAERRRRKAATEKETINNEEHARMMASNRGDVG